MSFAKGNFHSIFVPTKSSQRVINVDGHTYYYGYGGIGVRNTDVEPEENKRKWNYEHIDEKVDR